MPDKRRPLRVRLTTTEQRLLRAKLRAMSEVTRSAETMITDTRLIELQEVAEDLEAMAQSVLGMVDDIIERQTAIDTPDEYEE